MKIETIEQALALVPTHWMLTPGVDKWALGDRRFVGHPYRIAHNIIRKELRYLGQKLEEHEAGDRPIPQSVREAEARRIIDCQEPDDIDLPLWRWVQEGRG